jgi:hypothetical protein
MVGSMDSLSPRSRGGETTFPIPTFHPCTQNCGGLWLPGVYSGDADGTMGRAVMWAMRPPEEDGTRCLSITFLGERIPVVSCVGVHERVCALAPAPGLVMGDLPQDGGEWVKGEAGPAEAIRRPRPSPMA